MEVARAVVHISLVGVREHIIVGDERERIGIEWVWARGGVVDVVYLFFFSSRRRHTRFDCDWSSDVCSSDLPACRRRGLRSSSQETRLERSFERFLPPAPQDKRREEPAEPALAWCRCG